MSSFKCIASRNQCTESFKGLMNHVLITTLSQTTSCAGLLSFFLFFFSFFFKAWQIFLYSVAKISYLNNLTRTAITRDFVRHHRGIFGSEATPHWNKGTPSTARVHTATWSWSVGIFLIHHLCFCMKTLSATYRQTYLQHEEMLKLGSRLGFSCGCHSCNHWATMLAHYLSWRKHSDTPVTTLVERLFHCKYARRSLVFNALIQTCK